MRHILLNTRTVLTIPLIRWLNWNNAYHAEHHAIPTVPFHALGDLHRVMGPHFEEVRPGYVNTQLHLMSNGMKNKHRAGWLTGGSVFRGFRWGSPLGWYDTQEPEGLLSDTLELVLFVRRDIHHVARGHVVHVPADEHFRPAPKYVDAVVVVVAVEGRLPARLDFEIAHGEIVRPVFGPMTTRTDPPTAPPPV